MQKALIILSTFLFSIYLNGQEAATFDVHSSCSFVGEITESEIYTFESSEVVDKIIKDIEAYNGVSSNTFEVKVANVPNAAAVMEGNKRFIVYSQRFMEDLVNETGNNWSAYSILAHEIAHHLNGHTLNGGSRPSQELQSDQYSGFVLGMMNASLEDAQSAINLFAATKGTDTHPPKSARLEAIAIGWRNGKNLLSNSDDSKVSEINNEYKLDFKNVEIYYEDYITTLVPNPLFETFTEQVLKVEGDKNISEVNKLKYRKLSEFVLVKDGYKIPTYKLKRKEVEICDESIMLPSRIAVVIKEIEPKYEKRYLYVLDENGEFTYDDLVEVIGKKFDPYFGVYITRAYQRLISNNLNIEEANKYLVFPKEIENEYYIKCSKENISQEIQDNNLPLPVMIKN